MGKSSTPGVKASGGSSGIVIGGDNSGPITVRVAKDPGDPEQPIQPIHVQKARRLPITTTTVGTVSALLTIVMFVGGWQSVSQMVDGWRSIGQASTGPAGLPETSGWVLVFGGAVLGAVLGWVLWGFMRRHVYQPLVALLPGLAGVRYQDGKTRLTTIRLGGTCIKCGSKLRFYAKPVEWRRWTDSSGNERRKVTRREPVAECTRSAKHCYHIDITDNDFDSPIR